jgi:hypothetical protein
VYHSHNSLEHILAINGHPQADIKQRNVKGTHPIYMSSVKNKLLRITDFTRKYKNVNAVDNVMLTYS